MDAIDVSRVRGVLRGYILPNVQSARADLQPLMLAYGIEAAERDGKIEFFMRAEAQEIGVDPEALVRRDGPVIGRQRAPSAETARRMVITHMDAAGDFEIRSADARLPGAAPYPVSQSEIPLSLTQAEGHGMAERFLTEINIARDVLELELPASHRSSKAGQLLRIDGTGDLWRIDRIEEAAGRKVQAIRTERAQYEPSDLTESGSRRLRPSAPLPVDVTFLDLPLLTGEEVPYAPYVAVYGRPWQGSVAVLSSPTDANYRLNTIVPAPARVGSTLSVLGRADPGVFDNGPELLVRLPSEDLASVSEAALLSGANAVAIGDGGLTGWEIFQFRDARLVAPQTWALSRRLRGQRGTDRRLREPWPAGSRLVFLDADLPQVGLPREAVGIERFYRIGPAGLPVDSDVYVGARVVGTGEGLRPYAPVHLRAEWMGTMLNLAWTRRSRIAGDGWGIADVPLGETREAYLVRVLDADETVLHELEVDRPRATVSVDVFGVAAEGSLSIVVAQLSDEMGPGGTARLTVR